MSLRANWRRRLGGFARHQGGGIVVAFAIAVPALAVLACGAIDLAAVSMTKSEAQNAADAAALDVAHQLGVADVSGIPARAEALVKAQLAESKSGVAYQVTTTLDAKGRTVTVALVGVRDSFFMNLLPPGGWHIHASATAMAMGRQPLCVLSSGIDSLHMIEFQDTAQMSAPGCMVQSNGDIKVGGGALLSAGSVQAGGTAQGSINPAAQTGSALIDDPFASMAINPDSMLCNPLDVLNGLGVVGVTLAVSPGVHCGNIVVSKDQSLTLLPGEHYFRKGKLKLDKNASITGNDVVMVFDSKSDFSFKETSQIKLDGRKSGVFAGFVIATTRDNTGTFEISSDSARELLGTIYIPAATLLVTGSGNKVADQSAWTVIVAKAVKMTGGPQLVINANYAGSSVPVPSGVGPRANNVTLSK
ncbi:hypothetical protein BH11PSE2_BH11PSE2_13560 [soil metagenome]